jgi:hypothetical protein
MPGMKLEQEQIGYNRDGRRAFDVDGRFPFFEQELPLVSFKCMAMP